MVTFIFLVLIIFFLGVALESAILLIFMKLFRVVQAAYIYAVRIVLLLMFVRIPLILLSLSAPFGVIFFSLYFVLPLIIFLILLRRHTHTSWWKLLVVYILSTVFSWMLSFAIVIPMRGYVMEPFFVRGAAMEPTFFDRDYLSIKKFNRNDLARGDIVVFRYPRDQKQFFIKRIVGLPNERIVIKDGGVFVNGILLQESYLQEKETRGNSAFDVVPNTFFVLGDNRESSLDSRVFGPVAREHIAGKVWFKFPFQWKFSQ